VANSHYNSFQASLSHSSGSLSFLAGYTYSKCMDNASGLQDSTNPFNPALSISLCNFDVMHNFVFSYNWLMPFDKYVTADLLREVARAYASGRLLFIATTNLDARQPVVWDMGAIATRGDGAALDLFRKVMLASTSIPGVFPPVMLDVEVDGKRYQEMHVDGAVMKQVFLVSDPAAAGGRERHLYVIRNGRIDAQWGSTERRTTAVAHRALDALVDRQAVNDIYRLQFLAQQEGSDLNIAYIDSGFDYPHAQLFAGDYMRRLFQYSYQLGANGYPWRKSLPDAEWAVAQKAQPKDLLRSDLPLSVAAAAGSR